MALAEGAVIVVPEELKDTILQEGYRCSRRRRIPCSHNRVAALRAFQHWHPGRRHAFITVLRLPSGVSVDEHKDGLKINVNHLPASYVSADLSDSTPPPYAPFAGFAGAPTAPFGADPIFDPARRQQAVFDLPRQRQGLLRTPTLALQDIYYTQNITAHFRDSRTLEETRRELASGATEVRDIPTITVVEYSGRFLTVDNRRVCVFKRVFPSSYKIPVRYGVQDDRFFNKLKQPRGGTSIFVRGRGF